MKTISKRFSETISRRISEAISKAISTRIRLRARKHLKALSHLYCNKWTLHRSYYCVLEALSNEFYLVKDTRVRNCLLVILFEDHKDKFSDDNLSLLYQLYQQNQKDILIENSALIKYLMGCTDPDGDNNGDNETQYSCC